MTFYYFCDISCNSPYPDGYICITAPNRKMADMLFKQHFPKNNWRVVMTEENVKELQPHEWAEQHCHQAIGIFIETKPSIIPLLAKIKETEEKSKCHTVHGTTMG